MLPRKNRVPKEEMAKVFTHGKKTVFDGLALYSMTDFKKKFSVVIPKKTISGAVDRNKAKRRVRSAVLRIWPKIKERQRYVLLVKNNIMALKYGDLMDRITLIFQRAHLTR
jgi:ribonuclease P protein component